MEQSVNGIEDAKNATKEFMELVNKGSYISEYRKHRAACAAPILLSEIERIEEENKKLQFDNERITIENYRLDLERHKIPRK